MKATKKIVGAACALVAAVALSAGSTFAWFAANGTVTATGLTISANTEAKYLVISTTSTKPTTEQRSVNFATGTATLTPVAHDALTTSTTISDTSIWYTDVSLQADNAETNDTASTAMTLTLDSQGSGKMYSGSALSETNVYVLKQTFYLWWYSDKNGSSTATTGAELSNSVPLYCSYNVGVDDGSSDSIPGVVDVVFSYSSSNTASTAPSTYMCGNVAASFTASGDCIDATRARTYSLGNVTMSSYTATIIDVYIYINGEDANVKNTNATKLDGLTLSVAFSTESKAAAMGASTENNSYTECTFDSTKLYYDKDKAKWYSDSALGTEATITTTKTEDGNAYVYTYSSTSYVWSTGTTWVTLDSVKAQAGSTDVYEIAGRCYILDNSKYTYVGDKTNGITIDVSGTKTSYTWSNNSWTANS